ncbi:hypothetical protein [Thalassospira lucentensis]|uniref:hypothetical protein n=1 Tax=Thalassospira lucentensis TaxID=168935 RepID=UPI003D2C4875
MVLIINPQTASKLLSLTLPGIILGKKKTDPTSWRVLSDILSGKTKRPHNKTVTKIIEKISHAQKDKQPYDKIINDINEIPDDYLWEPFIYGFVSGRKNVDPSYNEQKDLFIVEISNLDKLSVNTIKKSKKSKKPSIIKNEIYLWPLGRIPTLTEMADDIDTRSIESTVKTSSPTFIVTSLYLMACWSIESFGENARSTMASLLPKERNGQIVRPIRNWLECIKEQRNLSTAVSLSDYFLRPNSEHEDIETLRRIFRGWWNNQKVPTWSETHRISQSLNLDHKDKKPDDISFSIQEIIGMIRIMDHLLNMSFHIKFKYLPNYNSMQPFLDFDQIYAYAESRKSALEI